MEQGTGVHRWWRTCWLCRRHWPGPVTWAQLGAGDRQDAPAERQETISLADAALRALKHNLDINISRQTKESRLADITVEQAKFDPTLSVNGQYNRTVNPLNRPVFGFSQGPLNDIKSSTNATSPSRSMPRQIC